jgi:hypothetical protein
VRILALTCEVLARSVYLAAARSPHIVDVHLNRRGLHDNPPNLRQIIQAEVDEAGPPYDAVVVAYGLCGAALVGVTARNIPLVLPRAHDCITLFLGARDRYAAEQAEHPGTFWYVQDYLERAEDGGAFAGVGANSDAAARATHAEYVEKYGQDNADYLMEIMGAWRAHYDRAAFVDMAVAPTATEAEAKARAEADSRGWQFERLAGEMSIVRRLIDGEWDDADFLTLQPGQAFAMSYDDSIVKAVAPA